MKRQVSAARASAAALLVAGFGAAPAQAASAAHPDLSGLWTGVSGSDVAASYPVKREADGSIRAGLITAEVAKARGGFKPGTTTVMPKVANPPPYKDPAELERATQRYMNGQKTDPTVACAQPGLPRVGAPKKIVQTAREIVFLYPDLAGMVYRVIPLDGRGYREDIDPSFYGDSVGRWEGDTLVVESRNFVDSTWIGEFGYLHSDQMRTVERLKRDGDKLSWQITIEDPAMLSQPWAKAPVTLTKSDVELEEPLPCNVIVYDIEQAHHIQRVP